MTDNKGGLPANTRTATRTQTFDSARKCPNCGNVLALEEIIRNGQPLTQYTCRKRVWPHGSMRAFWRVCFVEWA